MIRYRSRGLRIVESWFRPPANANRADIVRVMQAAEPMGGTCAVFRSPHLDLRESSDMLFGRFKKDTRRDIRKARDQDRLIGDAQALTESTWEDFAREYDRFATSRGLPGVFRPRLGALSAAGFIVVSRCRDQSERVLTTHAYVVASGRARLLHSFSNGLIADRALIGRANRLHHWDDIVRFRASGTATYDLGGWYGGTADAARSRIDRFKEEFGGDVVVEYNCTTGLSLAGRAYTLLSAWRQAVWQ